MPFSLLKLKSDTISKKEITINLLNNFVCEECICYRDGSGSCGCKERLTKEQHSRPIAHEHTCKYFQEH